MTYSIRISCIFAFLLSMRKFVSIDLPDFHSKIINALIPYENILRSRQSVDRGCLPFIKFLGVQVNRFDLQQAIYTYADDVRIWIGNCRPDPL